MFFVIDFETSALEPWDGIPLTLGVVAVNEDGNLHGQTIQHDILHNPRFISGEFYARFPITVYPNWLQPTPTEKWWLDLEKENPQAFEEAWGERKMHISTGAILRDLRDWMTEIEEDISKRFLCANPAAFDVMWLNYLYRDWEKPYHYRNLCLRSMRYGVERGFNAAYGNSRDENRIDKDPEFIKHHALWDARQEAADLGILISSSILLRQRDYQIDTFEELLERAEGEYCE